MYDEEKANVNLEVTKNDREKEVTTHSEENEKNSKEESVKSVDIETNQVKEIMEYSVLGENDKLVSLMLD